MGLFALGSIDPLLVDADGFSGFDLPSYIQAVRLLSDGSSLGPHEVLQSSGVPARQATITGVLTAADCLFLRRYDQSKEIVTFYDGNGNPYDVRVLALTTKDYTDWWTFSATLYCVDEIEAPGS
jgi:hypothetical protein